LEENEAAEDPTHKAQPTKQSESEVTGDTGRPALPEFGGQHERRQKATDENLQQKRLITPHPQPKHLPTSLWPKMLNGL
jgi:hypothetical protein